MSAHPTASSLVRRLWQYCNVLRDDGLSYPDYVEQLTYLLFLKMSDEQIDGPVPARYSWRSFANLDPQSMHRHYGETIAALGERDGMLGLIFRNAKNKVRDPAKLRLLVTDLIGRTDWSGLSDDVKGDAYEGLLEKNARDTKSGAGQYFTPRPLIDAIVECVNPRPGEVICDPACGTGGFLLAAHEHVHSRYPRKTMLQAQHLRAQAIRGVELVEEVARLATMNLVLHGVSGQDEEELPIECADSLQSPPTKQVDVVLTNPPFGIKGSITYMADEPRRGRLSDDLQVMRPGFWVTTSNKQLNFLQHVVSLLRSGGRAAVVLPDNVLFDSGAAAAVRRRLLETCDVHTLLRLPPGLFYAQGVKANVLFFNKPKRGRPSTEALWVYDLRSDNRFSLKTRPLRRGDLDDFVTLFQDRRRSTPIGSGETMRWRAFPMDSVLTSKHQSLDLQWELNVSERPAPGLSRLDEIAYLITVDLQRALGHIAKAASEQR